MRAARSCVFEVLSPEIFQGNRDSLSHYLREISLNFTQILSLWKGLNRAQSDQAFLGRQGFVSAPASPGATSRTPGDLWQDYPKRAGCDIPPYPAVTT